MKTDTAVQTWQFWKTIRKLIYRFVFKCIAGPIILWDESLFILTIISIFLPACMWKTFGLFPIIFLVKLRMYSLALKTRVLSCFPANQNSLSGGFLTIVSCLSHADSHLICMRLSYKHIHLGDCFTSGHVLMRWNKSKDFHEIWVFLLPCWMFKVTAGIFFPLLHQYEYNLLTYLLDYCHEFKLNSCLEIAATHHKCLKCTQNPYRNQQL